jgi:hypothetical protein
MATTYKVLGQLAPAATTALTLYTCPSATQTVISSLVVANRGASSATYRIAIRPNGASLSAEHYIVYDASLAAYSTTSYTIGATIDASDIITVYASNADFSFNAFGSEIA